MLSPFIHKFETEENKYIYDVNTNNVLKVDNVIYDIIGCYGVLSLHEIIAKFGSKYGVERIKHAHSSITMAKKKQGLFSSSRPLVIKYPKDDIALQLKLDSQMSTLILNVTEQCNLRCRYCIFSDQYYYTRNHAPRFMTFDIARKAIDFFLSHSMLNDTVFIGFYGGEPLLNKPLIKDCVNYVETVGIRDDVRFSITTNGTLIDDETIQFFIEKDFSVCVSLDGPKAIHNRNRVFKNGRGSHDKVVKNLRRLYQANEKFYITKVSFNMVMPPPYDLLAHNNFVCDSDLIKEHTSVNPIRLSEAETTYFDRFSIDDLKLKGYDEILYIYKHAAIDNQLNLLPFRREFKFVDAYFRQGIVQIYKRELMGELGSEYHPGGICIPGLRKLFVSVDGNLFPCEKCNHANKLLCIGSVYHGLDYRKIANLINKYLELCPDDCINCWVAGAFCSICYAFAEEADGSSFSPDRKRRACNACRNTCHNNLVLCYSILERNSKAFDFIRRIEIKKD